MWRDRVRRLTTDSEVMRSSYTTDIYIHTHIYSPFVAKSCIEEFIEPLTYMINESLRTGVCPSELKIARVVPIFKSGDSSLLTNYM